MSRTITYVCKADVYIVGPSGAGFESSDYLPVGKHGTHTYRVLVDFPLPDWAGLHVTKVLAAKLRMRNSSQVVVDRGATPRIFVRRVLEKWSSRSVTWDTQPTATTSGEIDSGTLATGDGTWVEISVATLVRAWAPTTVQGGGAHKPYGWKLDSFDEGSTVRTTEFLSIQTSSDPQLVLTLETDTAPEAPINLSPAGDDAIGAISPGRTMVPAGSIGFTGERVDVDPGDWVGATEVAVHADAATDGAPGSAIVSAITTYATRLPTFLAALSAAALTIGTHYRWRAKTRDKNGLWGPWSSFADGRFVPDYLPRAPINLSEDQASLTPTFRGSISSQAPGAQLGAVRIVVYQDTTLGTVLKWDTGFDDTSGTRFEVAYGGTPLEVGMAGLRWAAQVRDQYGAEGPLSAYRFWTPAAVTGPDAMSPIDVETKQDTLTPILTIGHSAAFDAYELELARFADGSGVLWDVPPTTVASTSSTDVVYAGTALTWGATYWWRAKVRVAGTTWTEFSPWYPFYVNAQPLTPIGTVADAVDSGDHLTVTTATADVTFPFLDPDIAKGYDEEPTRQEIEIEELDGTPLAASPYVATSSIDETFTTPTLVAETIYRVRCRYDDTAGERSPWSAYVNVKRSVAPSVAQDGVVDETDPNPAIAWTYSSSPGKDQAGYRVQVFDDATGDLVHDSGFVASTDLSYEVPGEILEDATDYRATVVVYDTDLLSDGFDVAVWTTDFDTPNELTNLVATPDRGDSSVLLEWDVSDLDPDLFWRYYIYRLIEGAFVRIGSVDDIATPTYTDFEAPHGPSTYAVRVSNGWAESEAVTATVTLNLDWWVSDPNDPSLRFELLWVTAFRSRHELQAEDFVPLGREFPVVVSGEQLAPAGTLSILLGSDDAEVGDLLLRACRVSPYVVLKDPFGASLRVKLGTVDRDRGPASTQTLAVDYRTVA